jgi:hypothetical protein
VERHRDDSRDHSWAHVRVGHNLAAGEEEEALVGQEHFALREGLDDSPGAGFQQVHHHVVQQEVLPQGTLTGKEQPCIEQRRKGKEIRAARKRADACASQGGASNNLAKNRRRKCP